MRKFLPLLLLIAFLFACAAPVVETAPEPVQVIQSTPTVVPSPTFTALPTIVPPTEAFPTYTPPTVEAGQPIEIRFPVNGTYVDRTDNIVSGGSKTYSLNAMQGQVMSVSVLPQADAASTISMQIKGADGSVLCPKSAEEQCLFWRGMLPASQDYFITLTPDGNGLQFVMRVAINPLNMGFQYFDFKSPTGFSLTYPDTFAPALPVPGNYKTDPELTLQFIESELYEKTNLSEVYLFVSSTSDAQTVATCTEPNQSGGGPEYPAGNEVINGITFSHSTSEGAGAGNFYQQQIYRTVRQNTCYEVIYYIHSTNVGNYAPGTVTEFNRDAVMRNLQAVLSMFTIK
jgi:hypothetical protein